MRQEAGLFDSIPKTKVNTFEKETKTSLRSQMHDSGFHGFFSS